MTNKKQHRYEVVYETTNPFNEQKETRTPIFSLYNRIDLTQPKDLYDQLPKNAVILSIRELEDHEVTFEFKNIFG